MYSLAVLYYYSPDSRHQIKISRFTMNSTDHVIISISAADISASVSSSWTALSNDPHFPVPEPACWCRNPSLTCEHNLELQAIKNKYLPHDVSGFCRALSSRMSALSTHPDLIEWSKDETEFAVPAPITLPPPPSGPIVRQINIQGPCQADAQQRFDMMQKGTPLPACNIESCQCMEQINTNTQRDKIPTVSYEKKND